MMFLKLPGTDRNDFVAVYQVTVHILPRVQFSVISTVNFNWVLDANANRGRIQAQNQDFFGSAFRCAGQISYEPRIVEGS